MRIDDLHLKEVINISTGQRLGYVSDLEFDIRTGKVLTFIVPGPRRFFGLLPAEMDYVFPWESIVRMGDDTILIQLDAAKGPQNTKFRKNCENSLC